MSSRTVLTQLRVRRPLGMNRLLPAIGLASLILLGSVPGTAHGQFPGTYTKAGGGNFSNVDEWNFGQGFSGTNPVPFSNPAGVLTFQVFGTNGPSVSNDFNLTLNTIIFNAYSPTANIGLSNTLGGTYTFAGAGQIQLNGDGGASGSGNFGANMAVGFVLGSTATGVTFNSAGSANGINVLNTNISGTVSSNTYTGGPITVNTGGLANTGVLTFNSSNTFAGGVNLVSGNINLSNAGAIGIFGNVINTLNINSTSSGAATISASAANTFLNPIVTHTGGGDLVLTGGRGNESAALTLGGLLGNGVSGGGNVIVRPAGTSTIDVFQGINTYTGSTTIGQIQYASNGTPGVAGVMRLQGAVGQLTATTGISVSDGGIFEITKNSSDSVNNARVNAALPISLTSSMINYIGSGGFTTQSVGQVTAAGGDVIAVGLNGASASLTISNLVRSGVGTVTFSGTNLGNAAAAIGSTNANIVLNNINGAAPSAALVGGGGAAGSTTISIIPWAIGDGSTNSAATTSGTTSTTFGAGTGAVSGFVTYGANGVRVLTTAANEYNVSNNFDTAGATDNFRVTAATTGPTAGVTVNSVFIATTGLTVGGAGALTISSGALASNVLAATISGPVNYGPGGTGEAIVTTLGAIGSANTITLNGVQTASTLTKTGPGVLILGNAGNAFSGNAITVNAGQLQVPAMANLGISQASPGASTITFDMQTSSSLNGGLIYSGTTPDTLNSNIVVNSGHAEIRITGASGSLVLGGTISGPGWVNFDPGAASALTLAANNSYTGGTRIGGGSTWTLNITSDANLGAPNAPLVINSNGNTTKLGGSWTTSRQIALEGAWGASAVAGAEGLDTAGNNATWNGQILGASGIFKIDSSATPGTWTIASHNNPYSGTIQLGTTSHAGGTLKITGDINAASVTFGPAAAGVAGTYVLDLSGGTDTGWRQVVALNTATGFTQAHTVQLGNTAGTPVDLRVGGNTAFGGAAGQIVGFGSLIANSGTFTLNGTLANTFKGDGQVLTAGRQVGVEIWGGTFQANADNLLGDASNDVAMKGGKWQVPAGSALVTNRNFLLQTSPYTLVGAGPDNTWNIQNTSTSYEIDGQVFGSGGFEFNTAGTLYLRGNNTTSWVQAVSNANTGRAPYGGIIKVNTGNLKFDSDANLGDAANKICLLIGGTLELSAGQGTSGSPVVINRFIGMQNAGSNIANLQVDTGSFMTYSGSYYSGNTTGQTLNKVGPGVLNLDANLSTFIGTFSVGNGTAAAGNVFLTANAKLPRTNVTLAAASTATLDMSGQTRDIGNLNVNSGTTLAMGTNSTLTFGFNNGAQSIAGAVNGVASDFTAQLVQVGSGTTTLSANLAANAATFAGGYTVGYTGGLTFSATGTLPNQVGAAGVTVGMWGGASNRGPTLSLESSIAHLSTSQNIYLNDGELSVVGAAAPVTQTMATLNGVGYSIVTVGTTTAGANVSFTDASFALSQNSSSTYLFRSGSTGTLGSGAASGTLSNLKFTSINGLAPAANLIGGGGAAGSTTISILPFAVGDDSATGLGSTFVTYGANGVRTLQAGTGEYAAAFGGSATDNVRLVPAGPTATVLAADTTANSLNIAGLANSTAITSTTTQKLIITSGAILNTVNNVYTTTTGANGPVGLPQGIQTAEIQTGGGNNNPLYVYATGGDLAIGAKVTTSGGLVVSGSGNVYLTNASNSYTGVNNAVGSQTTINGGTLVIDSLGAINDGAGNFLTLAGGFLKYRGPSASMVVGGGINLGGFQVNGTALTGGINVVPGTNLTLPDSSVSGAGGLVKEGTGILTLLGAGAGGGNTFTGPVIIRAGQVAIDSPLALGGSPRILFDAPISGAPGATLKFLNPMTITQEIDVIAAATNIGAGFDTNGNAVTVSGTINAANSNINGLYKFGTGNLSLTAAELYTGATQVFGGSLTLSGNGSVLNSGIGGTGTAFSNTASLMANFGSSIVLDNTATANSTRIPSGYTTTLSSGDSQANGGVRLQGGNLTLIGNATTSVNEYAGQFNVFAGTVTLTNNGASTVLTSGRLVRTSNDTVGLIRGTNLGSGAPGATNTNWFLIDQGSGSTALTGAGGAKGTPFINILPGFMGDQSATGTGTDLVTYDPAVGIRLLAASEYQSNLVGAGSISNPNYDDSRAPNLSISASTATPNFATWAESLKLSGSAVLSGSAGLIVRQSTILATGNGTPSITVPVLGSFGNGGYDFLVSGTTNLTVNSNLNGSQLFVFGGTGSNSTLTLGGAYFGTGQVYVGQGATLAMSGSNALLNPVGSNVNVAFGGGLSLGGVDRIISSINTQSVIGTFNLNQVSDGTIALGSNKLTLYDNATSLFTGQITGSSSSNLTKGFFSAGTTTLTQPQPSFSGTVRVNNGNFQLASGGTLPNAALLDIRGGTVTFNNQDDNGAVGGYVAQRVSASMPINLAGNLTFTGNDNAIGNHTLGAVALVGGGTVTVSPGANAPSTLTVANLSRATNRGTLTVVPSVITGAATLVTSGFGGTGTGWTANIGAGNLGGTGTFTAANNFEITSANNSQAASLWYNTPVGTGPFKVTFTYTVPAGSGQVADGMTFGFQNAPTTPLNALGGGGGSLGYSGGANGAGFVAVTPSAVFQMNNYTGNGIGGSGVGVITNAAAPGTVTATGSVNLTTLNSPVNVTLIYDGANLSYTLQQGANTNTGSFAYNLAAVGSTAFMGFTGATGGLNEEQHITNFTYSTLSVNPSLGLAQAANTGSRIILNNIEGGSPALALSGGGGAPGTTTVSILPWAWSTSGSFVTYDPTNGIRPLNIQPGTGTEYVLGLTSGANSFDNVRTVTAQTLTAATEVNSLILTSGGLSGAFNLGLRSGALASTAAQTIGNIGNSLLTGVGGADNKELVIFTAGNTTLNYSMGTSAGVTKFGGATLTLAGVSTFAGNLAINGGTVAFSADNQLGNASNAVVFGLATNNASPNGLGLQYTGTVLAMPVFTRNLVTNSFGGILGPQNQVTTINGTISGTGVFAYNNTAGAGSIYEVNGTNTYTGDTYLNFGQISIASDANLGNGSTLQINSGTGTDGIDLRANWTTSKTLHMRSAGGIDTNGFTATINGPIIGTAGLTKFNNGFLVLTAPNPTTGVITVNAGGLRLTGNGAVVATPSMGFGTQLVLDDTGTHVSDRLPENSGTLTGNNTEIQLLGNSAVTTEQVMGSLTLGSASKLTVAPGAGQGAILRLGQGAVFTRSASSSILFRGPGLGSAAPGTSGVASIMIFNPTGSGAALTGGGGPNGNTAISVIAGAFTDTSTPTVSGGLATYAPGTGNGTGIATYDFNTGVRPLSASEFASNINNGTVMVDNIRQTVSNAALNNATTINTLWLDNAGGAVSIGGTGPLTITAGNVLVSGTTGVNGNTINVPITTGGSNAIAVGGPGDVNITAVIPATSTGGLIKTGDGNLTLSAANLYTGTTYLASGTLTINNNAALPAAQTFRILGGTLAAGSPGLTLTLTNATSIGLDGDLTFGGNNDLTITATLTNLDSGARAFNIASGRTLTLNGTLAASNTSVAGNGISVNGGGRLILTGNNTYGVGSGSAAAPGFYLTQTNVNSSELRINGQTGANSGTGGSTVAVNGTSLAVPGILSGNGQIIPNQQLQARNLVNINAFGIVSPGQNTANPNGTLLPGTMTVGSSATAGVTTAEMHENANSYFRFLYTSSPLPVNAAVDTGGSETAGSTTGNNELVVNGALVLDAGAKFQIFGNFLDFTGGTYSFLVATATSIPQNYDITYAANPGSFDTSNFANFNPVGVTMEVHNVGNNEYFNITTSVPEPSSLMLIGAGAVGLAGAIRRKRAAAAKK
jgi:autotransporter-associated beta strand protein